jgi:hypothetical protein
MLRNIDPSKPRLHGNEHLPDKEDPIPGVLVLISNNETQTGETTTSTNETTLFTLNIPANKYSKILIESTIRHRHTTSTASICTFTDRIKVAGATQVTYIEQLLSTTAGGTEVHDKISTVIAGKQTSDTAVLITSQMGTSNAANGILGENARIYGII